MKMLIDGKKVNASDGRTIDVYNPATGEFIDTVPAATREDIDRVLECSKSGFRRWKSMPLMKRSQIIERFIELLHDNCREILRLLCIESGKNVYGSIFEIEQVETLFRGYMETAKRYDGKILVPGTEAGHDGETDKDLQLVIHEPLGTVLAIVPFNAPLLLFGFKVAPALAAGNAVIVKPASDNPLAVIKAVELLWEAGVPSDAIQLVTGRGEDIGDCLIGDPRIDAITLTGSTQTGLQAAKAAAKHLAPCSLELGGNDAFILLEDGDVVKAAHDACFTRIGNAGQVCIAPKRFIIHRSLADEFTDHVIKLVKTVRMGFHDDLETEMDKVLAGLRLPPEKHLMGCLINENAAIRVEEQIHHTIEQGAYLAYGGKRHGAYVEPTVLTGVTREMDVAQNMEIFGPVIPIIWFDTIKEAIEIANSSIYGLSGCVYTADWKKGMQVAQEVQTGEMVINGTSLYRNQMQPFGGYKMSGTGKEGLVTLGEMMQEKNIVLKGFLN